MQKIAVAICGSSGIDYISKDHGMKVFRSKLLINNVEYVDYIDISAEEFYDLLKDAKELHSAQVSTGELINLIKEYRSEGYTDVIMISISSGLSGTYQGISIASMDIEGINVHPFDSLFVGYPEAYLALCAKKMVEDGFNVEEILAHLTKVRDNSGLSFTVDTLEYLRLNGRLSNAAAFVGSLLKIKPVLYFNDGKVVVKEKIRTKTKALDRLLDIFLEETKDLDITPFFCYTNNLDEAMDLRALLYQKTDRFKNVNFYLLPPVIGLHAGPGAIAIGYVPNIIPSK